MNRWYWESDLILKPDAWWKETPFDGYSECNYSEYWYNFPPSLFSVDGFLKKLKSVQWLNIIVTSEVTAASIQLCYE